MLIIQCSKKLSGELKEKSIRECSSDPLYSWHGHVFLFNRQKYVLIMNNKTRYNFILACLKRNEFKQFDTIITQAIKENLLLDGTDPTIVEKYMENCREITYTKTSERSIISQINEMIFVSKHIMTDDRASGIETDIESLNRWLNKFVMLKLPKVYSGVTMIDALKELNEGTT